MNPQGPRHTKLTVRIHKLLERTYGPGYHVQDHSPLLVSEFDLPEPDLVLVRGEPDALDEYTTGQDAALVVEIAVSSLARDREKAPIYAAGGVAEYWIVDVPGRRIEMRRGPLPSGREYREVLILDEDAVVRLPGRAEDIDVRALLPP